MKKVFLLLYLMVFIGLVATQGCATAKPEMQPGTMRIWLSPSHRSNVKVDAGGHLYVKVLND